MEMQALTVHYVIQVLTVNNAQMVLHVVNAIRVAHINILRIVFVWNHVDLNSTLMATIIVLLVLIAIA